MDAHNLKCRLITKPIMTLISRNKLISNHLLINKDDQENYRREIK